jgi:hypothetical protein
MNTEKQIKVTIRPGFQSAALQTGALEGRSTSRDASVIVTDSLSVGLLNRAL